jgi:type IV secretory pathway protease TraF
MVPVLPPGTLVVGTGLFRKLKPGQVVVINHDGREKIKRIDQVEGERIFVLGDHPETSTDSRHFGWVGQHLVIAKVILPRTRITTG